MKVKTEVLKSLVSKVSIGVGNDKLVPITELIGIKANSEKIELVSTDSNNYVFVWQECDTDIKGDDEFKVAVSADKFTKLIGKLNSEDVALKLVDGNLVVRATHGTYTIELQPDENGEPVEYPDPRQTISVIGHDYKTEDIKRIIQIEKSSLAKTLERPELTNYYASDSVFATDGSVVTQYKIKLFDEPVLISSRLMDIIGSITEENVKIYVQEDSISVLANGTEVFSRIADSASQYAIDKVKGFIDTEFSQWVKVNKNTLLNALDRIAIFVDKYDNQAVRLVFDRSDVVISNIKSGSEELVEIVEKKVDKSKKKFEPYEVYINVQMLTEQLKSYIGEVVTINYGVDFAISLSSENTTQIVSLMEV